MGVRQTGFITLKIEFDFKNQTKSLASKIDQKKLEKILLKLNLSKASMSVYFALANEQKA